MKERGAGDSELEGPPGGEERGEGTEENETHSEGGRAGHTEEGADGDPGQAGQLGSLVHQLDGQTEGEVEQALLTNSSKEPTKALSYRQLYN